jgi:hypothetical protein
MEIDNCFYPTDDRVKILKFEKHRPLTRLVHFCRDGRTDTHKSHHHRHGRPGWRQSTFERKNDKQKFKGRRRMQHNPTPHKHHHSTFCYLLHHLIITMSTPTHHSSITNFFNECEQPGPEESQISLDSSIEDSNIFAEVSAHSRFSNMMNRSRAASQSLLGPLEEDYEGSEVHDPSLSKNSSDAENHHIEANTHNAAETFKPNRATSTRSNTSAISQIVEGILKPSRFNPLSDPPPPPPPNPPPRPKNHSVQTKETPTSTREESPHRSGVPVLSVTTVLGKAKSDETDSAFMYAMNTNATAATPVNPTNHTVHTPTVAGDPSQRTSATFGMVPGNVPSETIHTSNLRMNENMGFHAREADRLAAWAIHIALIFFCGLVVASVLISFTVIRKYGLVALVGLILVVVFVCFLATFVDQTILSKNPKLRPIRQKIAAAVNATKGLIVEEYQLLIRDWNEHLLLTQGEEQYQAYSEGAGLGPSRSGRLPPPTMPQGRKRSKLFKFVKPFLGIKKKFGRGKRKNQAQSGVVNLGSPGMIATSGYVTSANASLQQQSYEPPEPQEKTGTMNGVMS